MILKTKRLILRPWEETDAEELYKYAKSEEVGHVAGWPVHTSVENSRDIIIDALSRENIFAVCLKDNKAIGSIGIKFREDSTLHLSEQEAEIGYWIGKEFWGKGFMPEAVKKIILYCFEELNLEKIWSGYYDGNEKSKRVQEKCGFKYSHTDNEVNCKSLNETRVEHFSKITKSEWELLNRNN